MNVVSDQDAIHGDANLAHIREGAPGRSRRGLLDIGILQHHKGALPAEFERDAFHVLRRGVHDRAPGRHGSGGRDHPNAGMGGQDGTDIRTRARQVVENARRQPDLGQAFDDHAGGKRRLVRRLHYHRATCGQRRADLPAVDIDRIIPRHDRTNHPDWNAVHQIAEMGLRARPHTAFDAAAFLSVVAQHAHAEANLLEQIGYRLALLAGQHHRDRIGALLDQISRLEHDTAALVGMGVRPDRSGALSRHHRAIDIGRRRQGGATDVLAGRRVPDYETRAGGGFVHRRR